MEENTEKFRKESFFWSRLGFCYDPPVLDEKGRQVIFSRDLEKYRRIHDEFRDAGVKYHTTILSSGWVGVDKYDYTLTDETLEALLCGNPDIYYMPRVKLNVPPDWCYAYPEETFVYFRGPRDAEGIRALTKTDRQDWFGFKSGGYPVNGGVNAYVDPHRNLESSIALQSFSSERWRKDAAEALRRLMVHIDETPYGRQTVGYHIAFGACGETTMWGSWVKDDPYHVGDYGISAVRCFREYEKAKYGGAEAAVRALGLYSEEDILPPSPEVRAGKKESLGEFMFHSGSSILAADYYEFLSNTNVDAIEYFCRTVKEHNEKYLTGAFYGYTAVYGCAHAGHLAIDRAVQSPYIDFLSSPKGYYKCNAGQPGGEQGPTQSVAGKKLWLDEIDNITHIDPRNCGSAKDLAQTKTVLWREVCKNLSRNCGFWFMDLGEGAFSSPEIMAQIRKMTEFSREINKREHRSISQVLLVKGDISKRRHSLSRQLHDAIEYELPYRLMQIGAPVDFLRVSDLCETELSQYKLIVFGDTFYFEAGQIECILSRLSSDAVILWHYAPGALMPEFSYENIRYVSGFYLREKPSAASDHPVLYIEERDGIEVLARYESGEAKIGSALHMGRRNILAAEPELEVSDLRRFAEDAKVELPAPEGVTVYGDNRFVSFFTGEHEGAEIKTEKGIVNIAEKDSLILERP